MNYIKYPRTFHAPWSEGATNDDKIHKDMSCFKGKRVIVTEKMDGENFSGYTDHCHARSIDSANHPSRNWAKSFWKSISYNLPTGWRVCAENVYARHSIAYENLKTYLYGISIWNVHNVCIKWDDTLEWFELLGIIPVPVLYDGIYDEEAIRSLWNAESGTEGYVIRLADSFHYDDFSRSVAKFVRKNHVVTDEHWMHSEIIPNKLV